MNMLLASQLEFAGSFLTEINASSLSQVERISLSQVLVCRLDVKDSRVLVCADYPQKK